jgi:hypothetical protein
MHDIQTGCSLNIQSPNTLVNQWLIQMNKMGFALKTESHYELLQTTKFPMSLHINLSPEEYLTGCCALCCMLLLLQELLQLGKVNTKLLPWEPHLLQVPHTNV